MIARLADLDEDKLHRLQQAVKWIVYILLLVNFGYYIYEDVVRARHVLTSSSTLIDWAAEFATSIDELGWFLLLFMFELETYVIEDDTDKRWTTRTVRGVRLVCYAMLAHTIFAYGDGVLDYTVVQPVDNVVSPCELISDDVSFVRNLDYTVIDAETCGGLTESSELFWVGKDPVVTDAAGLSLERQHAWVDLLEASIWLLILLAIEVVVRLQDRGITGGTLITTLNRTKLLLYATLIAFAAWWAWVGHWLYTWDELLWIGGFAAIEMNISEWRAEILEEA